MKAKKLNKKLALNKTTISNLGNETMMQIHGGLEYESNVDPEACASEPGGGSEVDCLTLINPCVVTSYGTLAPNTTIVGIPGII